ncbi:hypothetical protein EDD86DRAFT_190506 [Gorgonomyces haynaldii]|nr:hypothetical protein EDD86DRAFT_190506 [Gorgonomyces haynaldii]
MFLRHLQNQLKYRSLSNEAAALAAFKSRTGLTLEDKALEHALTHKSHPQSEDASLKYHLIGDRVLGLYAAEYSSWKYPNLPSQPLEDLANQYVSVQSLSAVGQLWGIQFVARSKNELTPATKSWLVKSIVGAIYTELGPKETRSFVKKHVLGRAVDVQAIADVHLKLGNPRRLLKQLAQKLGQPQPVARLLKETGRESVAPVFIVGMYSGVHKIGEGHGSSLKMAETRV